MLHSYDPFDHWPIWPIRLYTQMTHLILNLHDPFHLWSTWPLTHIILDPYKLFDPWPTWPIWLLTNITDLTHDLNDPIDSHQQDPFDPWPMTNYAVKQTTGHPPLFYPATNWPMTHVSHIPRLSSILSRHQGQNGPRPLRSHRAGSAWHWQPPSYSCIPTTLSTSSCTAPPARDSVDNSVCCCDVEEMSLVYDHVLT